MALPDPRRADASARPWTWCTVVLFMLAVLMYLGWQTYEILFHKKPSINTVALSKDNWRMPSLNIYGHELDGQNVNATCLFVDWYKPEYEKIAHFTNTETVKYWYIEQAGRDIYFFIESNRTMPHFDDDPVLQLNEVSFYVGFTSNGGVRMTDVILEAAENLNTYNLPLLQLEPTFKREDDDEIEIHVQTYALEYSSVPYTFDLTLMGSKGKPQYKTHYFGSMAWVFSVDGFARALGGPRLGDLETCRGANNWAAFSIRVDNPIVMSEEAQGVLAQLSTVFAKVGGLIPIFVAFYYILFKAKRPVNRLDTEVTWRWAAQQAVTEPVTRSMLDDGNVACTA